MDSFRIWLSVVGLVIAAGIAVPFGLLSGSAAALDVFAFWCLFGLAVIALIAVGSAGWRR